MKRFSTILITALCALLIASNSSAAPKETWISVRSKNFLLVGNASEREIRQVATRLEQFRDICARLFPDASSSSPVRTTVIVFKNDASYRPFKPLYQDQPSDVAGYFQPGPDLNYITLSTERRRESPYNIIFHEYFHLFVENNVRGLPLALNEGLAQFYSTLEAANEGKKITLGKPIAAQPRILLSRERLPLQDLLAVDYNSPYYNEHDKRDLFYAQSWALVHYLLLGRNGERASQLLRFLELLDAGASPAESFRAAFHVEMETIEAELKEYIARGEYPQGLATFDKRLQMDAGALEAAPITDAEAEAYLGDLLLHGNRLDEAEKYLQQALALNPELAMARSSLGMLRGKQKKYAEAKQYLQQAIRLNPEDYRSHYYYAYALSREEMDEGQSVTGYDAQVAATMRGELRRTIELAPEFAEAYRLLAFINLATNEQLDEAVALLRRALALAPGRQDSSYVLAQVYLRKRDFNAARAVLEALVRTRMPEKLSAQADQLLAAVARAEKQEELSRFNSSEGNYSPVLATTSTRSTGAQPSNDSTPVARQRLRKYFEGARVVGMLTRIECADDGVLLFIRVGDRTIRLRSDSLNRIKFLTYVVNIKGKVSCGPRTPENLVVATYRPIQNAGAGIEGETIAIEFVPEDIEVER